MFLATVSLQTHSPASRCFICLKPTEEDSKLKTYSETVWATMKKCASQRQALHADKYADVTRRVMSVTAPDTLQYHPACRKTYTAVKRPRPGDTSTECPGTSASPSNDATPPMKKRRMETRSDSSIPKYDEKGMLAGSCLFCGKRRKKKRGKEETLLNIATLNMANSIADRANRSKNDRIKALVRSGVPLIAKESVYHKTCYSLFLVETDVKAESEPKESAYHKKAFTSLRQYIKTEVLENRQPVFVSLLLDIYRTDFIEVGGDPGRINSYSAQSLQRKLKEHFGDDITVKLANSRLGNYIYSSALTEEEAFAGLHSEEHEENEKIKWVARHLRKQILQLPKSKTPNPANVQNLKESAANIPEQLDLFFKTLLGSSAPKAGSLSEMTKRKANSMASDAVFNVSRGSIKPWKHTALGLGLASMTGSKTSLEILNRTGHSISYSEAKGLETEFAYAVQKEHGDVPDGIKLAPDLGTASVWDNNDANIETLDGKDTFHATVGHTYQNVPEHPQQSSASASEFREGRNRRSFQGYEREIPAFHRSLNKVTFPREKDATTTQRDDKTTLQLLDLYWFWMIREDSKNLPMHAGFMSQFVKDPLPVHTICYMDPISSSPTNNDVVRETMIRTLNVAKEAGQEYAVVTYDLAVAKKAYAIQEVERPLFDELFILLGNFHVELAFYGALGTLISDSGIEFVLSEADVLAEGSVQGFIKGKFYNRCTRVHDMLATVLELKLYQRFLDTIPQEDADNYHQVMTSTPEDPEEVRGYLNNEVVVEHLNKYEEYFHSVMSGEEGAMAQFWGIYIYLVNRLHRELQRCVKTNDVRSYISIFPKIVEVFFALNRPNYSRWGMLFLQKLETANPAVMTILEKGAFSIRRTTRNFSRSAVDLSLEQTVNKDASSSARGIVAFRNSDQALRRWALTMTQRALAVSELKSLVGIEQENGTAAQCHPSQINKDNIQMKALGKTIDTFCNPFSDEAPSTLVNIATGRAANAATQSYLLSTIRRGQEAREKFEEEWDENRKRFTQPIKKVKVANFAAENTKKGPLASASKRAQTNAENLRDAFVKMIVVASQDSAVDLRHILKYPIIKYPLAFAHCDGSLVKTDKSSLLHHLEAVQMETINELDHPELYTHVYDGGLLLHSILSQTSIGASYASIARTILSVICASKGKEVHICLDKYLEDSIKGSERKLRGAVDSAYNITGPEQTIRQSGKKLLANGMFKDQLGRFLLQEWGKEHYWHILEGKTVIASFGGDCLSFVPDKESHHITVTRPAEYQGNHEEADTLISFHVANTSASHICVRASDTDVLVILIGMLARQRPEVRAAKTVIMECGMGNSRRYINVSNITDGLEDMKTGLPEALPGFHAFTGCDFTSAFYRWVCETSAFKTCNSERCNDIGPRKKLS